MTVNPPSADNTVTFALSEQEMTALQLCLAEQIGPAARIVLVRVLNKWSAEGKSPTTAYSELLGLLAAFIDSESKRSAFMVCAQRIKPAQ